MRHGVYYKYYIDLYSPTCASKENIIHTYIIQRKTTNKKAREKQQKEAMGKC